MPRSRPPALGPTRVAGKHRGEGQRAASPQAPVRPAYAQRNGLALSTAVVLSYPSLSRAQPAKGIDRVAVFDANPVREQHANARAFFDELEVVERRDVGGLADRMAEVARGVVDWNPDLIVASSDGRNLAIKAATSTILMPMHGVGDQQGRRIAADQGWRAGWRDEGSGSD